MTLAPSCPDSRAIRLQLSHIIKLQVPHFLSLTLGPAVQNATKPLSKSSYTSVPFQVLLLLRAALLAEEDPGSTVDTSPITCSHGQRRPAYPVGLLRASSRDERWRDLQPVQGPRVTLWGGRPSSEVENTRRIFPASGSFLNSSPPPKASSPPKARS